MTDDAENVQVLPKHTPGPWFGEGFEQTEGVGDFYGGLIMGADNETIVAQCVMPNNMPVIAAAPELLSALVVARDAMRFNELEEDPTAIQLRWNAALAIADSAIARATGPARQTR